MPPAVPRLVVITDTRTAPIATLLDRVEKVASSCPAGSVMVQLREHQLGVRERLALGRRLRELTLAHEQLLAVNDRLDIAKIVEADAIHLGDRSVAPQDARRWLGDDVLVSRACHAPGELDSESDMALLSPVFAERKGRPPLGMEGLRRALRARSTGGAPKIFALGGVSPSGASRALEAGADGVAVVGAVVGVDDAGALLRAVGLVL